MKLQLSYEIMFGYVQKLQISCLIPLKTINVLSYYKFFKSPGRAGPVFRPNLQAALFTVRAHGE